ncbi:MAG: enoyl-CoA hydratase/isomerase family protein [Actinomycetota bacterium]
MLLSPNQLADRLTSWLWRSELAASERPLVAMDLRAVSRASIGTTECDALVATLADAPWVSVVFVDADVDPTITDLVDVADVVLSEVAGGATTVVVDDLADELERLRLAVAASPQASVALVQLLRLADGAPVPLALHGESLTYATLQTGETFQTWLAARGGPKPRVDEGPPVQVERDGGLLRITLDRPERRNALNIAMRDALVEALTLLDLDPSLDGALLTGNGSNFSAGGDLDEFGSTPSPAMGHYVRTVRSLPGLVHQVRDRLRVHVHGTCVGAGIELPAFAHAVHADPDTTFRLPEIGFGLVPGAGGTVSVSRRCGRQRTAWWALRGVPVDADTALRWGLIDRIAPRQP